MKPGHSAYDPTSKASSAQARAFRRTSFRRQPATVAVPPNTFQALPAKDMALAGAP